MMIRSNSGIAKRQTTRIDSHLVVAFQRSLQLAAAKTLDPDGRVHKLGKLEDRVLPRWSFLCIVTHFQIVMDVAYCASLPVLVAALRMLILACLARSPLVRLTVPY
jgi:hypothetical protein